MFFRTTLTVWALILGLGAGSATILAQQPQPANPETAAQQQQPRRGMRRHARTGQHALEQINLTDAQRQQTRAIIQNHSQSTKTQREELRGLMQQWRAGTLSAEQQARAKELRQQLMESRKGVHTQMLSVLTPEQKAKLDEMRALRKANHLMFARRRRPVE